ncbi:hypothetical protein GCM10027030_18380 [Luteococcus sediminum]
MDNTTALSTILGRWKLLAITTLAGLLAGLGVSFATQPTYEATSSLFLTLQSVDSAGELAQTSDFTQAEAANYADLATREAVLAPTIQNLGLDSTVSKLSKQVSTEVPLDTSGIAITAKSSDAQQAADIANEASKNLSAYVAKVAPKVGGKATPLALVPVAEATPAEAPSAPSRPLYTLLGGVAGLLAGAGAALALGTSKRAKRREVLAG